MFNPEFPHFRVRTGKRQTVFNFRMGKESRVEIQTHASLLREIHPSLEMPGLDLITIHKLAVLKDGIAGMYIDFFPAGHQAHRLVQIGKQLIRRPGLAGIIAGGLNTAGQRAVMIKTDHVIALPAMKRYRNRLHFGNRRVCVHTHLCINLFCRFISCAHWIHPPIII